MDLVKIYEDLVSDTENTVVEIHKPLLIGGEVPAFSEEELFSLVLRLSHNGMERMNEIKQEASISGQHVPDQAETLMTIVLMAVLTGMLIERESQKEKSNA